MSRRPLAVLALHMELDICKTQDRFSETKTTLPAARIDHAHQRDAPNVPPPSVMSKTISMVNGSKKYGPTVVCA